MTKPYRTHAGAGPRRFADRRPGYAPDGPAVLYGWHPVAEALRNPDRVPTRLLATENAARRLAEELPDLRVVPQLVHAGDISRLLEPDAVHQGLYLEAEPLEPVTFETLGSGALVVALDQITDPHNVGAIIRSAAAFGATAILTTARHSPSATGVLAKAASGGLEYVPAIVVRNLAEALTELGRRAFLRIGLDSEGSVALGDVQPAPATVLVLGAEGHGLRQRTRECCDAVARLDMPGRIRSLNVSNAAAVALYALASRRVSDGLAERSAERPAKRPD